MFFLYYLKGSYGGRTMLSRYFTVKKEACEHEINIQKSRFIAHIKRTETEAEAQEFIQTLKKKYWDASHNCSAYIIGEHDQIQKANDDGEPSGTAGVPILEVLKKRKLKDTVVVITRYFGGVKLGAGGLIRAYGKATSEGLNTGGIVERRLVQIVHVTVDYTWIGKIEKELRASSYTIKDIHYLEKVIFEVYVDEVQVDEFMNWVVDLTNANCNFIKGENVYLEAKIN